MISYLIIIIRAKHDVYKRFIVSWSTTCVLTLARIELTNLKYEFSDRLLKITVIGTYDTGKSALISRFCDDTFSDSYLSTIGVDFVSLLS